ncbi:FtsX-like permease family protein [Streptomyces sp. NPDC050848]|uniref:FtsX-like permease family protein n=1 Tax=Streptomyces sp. NPDC050848 TaxID=3155791 RepID=UPI0033F71476
MLTVVLSGLRARWAAFVGSFVALALGVGLLTTMGLGLASTFDAPERAPQRFAGAPVVVKGRDAVTVDVRRGPGTATVSQKLDRPQPVDIELLAELTARWTVTTVGGPDAVGVHGPAAEVRTLVGDRAQVLTGDERRRADPEPERDAEALVAVNALLGTAGGVTTFVSVFVVASTFAFAVALRRREFGLLRTAGATPGQVRRMLLAEAAGVGMLASAAGCALGGWAAPWLARVLVDGGLAPEWFAIGGAAWPFHVAFWTGVTVALAGAFAASRRAGKVSPAAALREADVDADVLPLGRALLGTGLLVTGAGLLVWTCVTEPSELLKRKTYTTLPMLLITGVALLAPLLVRPVARALRLPGATGMLVRENSAAAVRRTAAVAAPVLVTVALAGSLLGSAATVTGTKAAEAREQTRAEWVVTGEDLRPVPGTSATGATSVFVRDGAEALVKYGARAVSDPAAFAELTRLPVVAGDVADLDDGSIVVNEEFERRSVGDVVQVWRADGSGPVGLRVVAVLALGTGDNGPYVTRANAPGSVVDRIDARGVDAETPAVAGGTVRSVDREAAGGTVRVVGAETSAGAGAGGTVRGMDGEALAAAGGTVRDMDREALAAAGGTVRSVDEWAAATHPTSSPETRLGMLLVLGIALVYTVIALANTLLMATSVRGGELAALRLAGATRAQILRVVTGESALAVAIGATLGLAVTAVCLAVQGTALATLSAPVALSLPWPALAATATTCALVAATASALPAWRATR